MLGGVRIGVWILAVALATGALALVLSSSTRRDPETAAGDGGVAALGTPDARDTAASGSGPRDPGRAAGAAAQKARNPDGSRIGSVATRGGQQLAAARSASDPRAGQGPGTDGRQDAPWGESRRPGEQSDGTDGADGPDDALDPALVPELAAELEEPPPFEEPSREPLPSPAEILSLEEEAARTAEALGLVDPVELEMRVEQRIPEGSVPPQDLARARDDLRRQLLADEAIVEDLVQSRYGNNRDETTRTLARGWARTLVPSQGPEFRAKRLQGLPERLAQGEAGQP